MTRSSFLKTITAAICASAMDICGWVDSVVHRRWKFETQIVRLENPWFKGWHACLTQMPINHKDGDGVRDCYQRSFKISDDEMVTPTQESIQWIADQLILQRQYELGEPS